MSSTEKQSVWQAFVELCIPYRQRRLQQSGTGYGQSQNKSTLKRALPAWQILSIAIGGVIGVTIFSTHGEFLRLAGPGGLLIATLFVALTMICVMECIGELVILWPVSNALVEYVRAFVDEDLAIVVGIAYWYAFSCIFSTLIIATAQFASNDLTPGVDGGKLISSDFGTKILFYAVVPLCMIFVNVLGVEYYGLIEGIAGIVKVLMVLSGILFMVAKAPQARTDNLDDGFKHQSGAAVSDIAAICYAIPLLSYGYLGVEIVSVTAFEAIDRESLQFPARRVSYIIAGLYFLSALLQATLVKWNDEELPSVNPVKSWYAIIVVAARHYSTNGLGKYFNACIVYFCISASNTSLYVASRTLFGLTRNLNNNRSVPFLLKPLRHFGTTTPTRQVPLFALLFSAVAFYWLVPLSLATGFEFSKMLMIMGTTASIGVILVWATQCIAFIRYYCWLRKFRDMDRPGRRILPTKYNRWEPQPTEPDWHDRRMLLSDLNLVPAVVGLSGCLWIVFVFSSATWWNGGVTVTEVATAYTGPIVLLIIFISLKLYHRRWWVVLSDDVDTLHTITGNLERSSNLRSAPVAFPLADVRSKPTSEVTNRLDSHDGNLTDA